MVTKKSLDNWIKKLFSDRDLLQMGHRQRLEDLNLGMGWIYYGLVRLIRPKTVVVIGSWRGFTPLVFGKALADNVEEGSVIFIDPSLVDNFWKRPSAVRRHFSKFGIKNIQHFCMTTQQFVRTKAYRSLKEVGIVMIDGYHTEQQARFDFRSFEKLVPAQGIVLLHDSCRIGHKTIYPAELAYTKTVKLFVDKLKKNPRWQVFDLPFASGLTLVRKLR